MNKSPLQDEYQGDERPPLPENRPPLPKNRLPLPENRPPVPLETRGKRIVGGHETDPGSHPWQVALMFRDQQVCSGAVITPSWIATAAHCFGK